MLVESSGRSSRKTGSGGRKNGAILEFIEYVPLSSLKPYSNHARRHSADKIRRLRNNINEFGFIVPLLVDANGVLVSGHARYLAATELGLDRVPVIRITDLNDAQIKAFRIADNRLAELAEWDTAALAVEFELIIEARLDVELTGFSAPEIDQVFGEFEIISNEDDDEEDLTPPIGEPVSRPGDVWHMENHVVLCGNSLETSSFERLMGQSRAAMIWSDPPYNVAINGHVSGNGRHQHREFKMASGEMSEEAFSGFLEIVISIACRFSHPNAPVYLFMDWRHAPTLQCVAAKLKLVQVNLCVWVKSNAGMGSFYRSQHELIFVFAKEGAKLLNNVELGRYGRNRSNVWQYPGANSIRGEARDALADHPTPKPVRLLADAILDVTRQADIVLDMFLGGGATLIACERTKRRCRGIEIDPAYVDVSVRRWQRETGRTARLKATGESFEQVMHRRNQPLLPDLREVR